MWIDLGLHPNIVSCYYVRDLGGIPRIFMEYVPGGSLKDRISKGIELKDALDLAIQICRGMAYAHEKKNLIHRDLNPANCLLNEDRTLKITDFGLAKIEEFTGEVPVAVYGKTGRAGTPEYMAPEQWYLARVVIFHYPAIIDESQKIIRCEITKGSISIFIIERFSCFCTNSFQFFDNSQFLVFGKSIRFGSVAASHHDCHKGHCYK